MSHFSTIQTKIKHKPQLIEALELLQYDVQENQELVITNPDHAEDHPVVHAEIAVSNDIGFRWNETTETYDLYSDHATWNLDIPYVEAPELPDGMTRDPVRKREDWSEVTDPFGMVSVALEVGSGKATKRALADWIVGQARIPEIALGEIQMGDASSTVQIHVEKASYVIDVIKKREFDGVALNPSIVEF